MLYDISPITTGINSTTKKQPIVLIGKLCFSDIFESEKEVSNRTINIFVGYTWYIRIGQFKSLQVYNVEIFVPMRN